MKLYEVSQVVLGYCHVLVKEEYQLPFMDFLMVASAIVGSFGVMLEGTILYIVGYQTGLSKAQIASIE